ncbi:MAG: glycoside hydrolase family 9 protein [Planctomycetota bacterium]
MPDHCCLEPRLIHCAPVAPTMIALRIDEGHLVAPRQEPYRPEPDDRIEERGAWQRILVRDGTDVGWVGGPQRDVFTRFPDLIGETLDLQRADDLGTWRVTVDGTTLPLRAVHRKTKPDGWVTQDKTRSTYRHEIYLALDEALRRGRQHVVHCPGLGCNLPAISFRHEARQIISPALHVSHVGFHPDDPVKCAFLSCWMGSGGGLSYPEDLRFQVLDEENCREVLSGRVVMHWPADKPEAFVRECNYNHCDVLRMDFTELRRTGPYRVVIPGIGCSLSFPVDPAVYGAAARLCLQGLYNQRSGLALEPPAASYHRPRSFHPEDGQVVYRTTASLFRSGNGLNAMQEDRDNFGLLVSGATDEPVADAWGGYMDAADWDRRIQHLRPSRLQLELLELFPERAAALRLPLPESDGRCPDLLHEVRWNLDCYRRMQTPDGGIRGGIESAEHPTIGECSWQESLRVYAYEPDPWSAAMYVSCAAKYARLLQPWDAETATIYAESARRAWAWIETIMAAWEQDGILDRCVEHARLDLRCQWALAALEYWLLAGDEAVHRRFRELLPLSELPEQVHQFPYSVCLHDAAFTYACQDAVACDAVLHARCRQLCLRLGEHALVSASGNAWGVAYQFRFTNQRDPADEIELLRQGLSTPYHGSHSVPGPATLPRAHVLSGDERFLAGAVQAAQFAAGANPMNRALTSGMGHDPVRQVQDWDSKLTGQPAPTGIPVYGLVDIPYREAKAREVEQQGGEAGYEANPGWFVWAPRYYLKDQCYPDVYSWPTSECHFDVGHWAPCTEYTPQCTIGPSIYVWGYLDLCLRGPCDV